MGQQKKKKKKKDTAITHPHLWKGCNFAVLTGASKVTCHGMSFVSEEAEARDTQNEVILWKILACNEILDQPEFWWQPKKNPIFCHK